MTIVPSLGEGRSPDNAAKQALMSEEWWASDAGIQAKARWLKFMQ